MKMSRRRQALVAMGRSPKARPQSIMPAAPHRLAESGLGPPRTGAWDDGLLERARAQWQYGDWASLRGIDVLALQSHPERAKLALLAAAGHLQAGDTEAARALLRRAADWGCNRRVIAQVLVASVHNVLGRAACVSGQADRARSHFEASIATVSPMTDVRLLGHARSVREMADLGMLPAAASLVSDAAAQAKDPLQNAARTRAHQKVLELEVDWLRDRVYQLQRQAQAGGTGAALVKAPKSAAPAPAPAPDKQYHGLHGLDRKLEAYLDTDGGYFVELGANDGVAQSNTLYFERERGWRGVLIEPILHNFLKCRQNRSPDNFFACAACVSSDYNEPFVRLTYANLMTTPHGVEGDIADPLRHAESGRIYLPPGESTVDVLAPARTLSSVLDEAGAPNLIDLLSLDVEGGELEVLKGIEHDRHRFRHLLIESRDLPRLVEYLDGVGYVQIDKLSQHDYLFAPR